MKNNKLSQLLKEYPETKLLTQKWLSFNGISRQLVSIYCKNGRLNKISRGLYVIPGHTPEWYDYIFTLQSQLNIPIHVGGLTALALHEHIHDNYLSTTKDIELYRKSHISLPTWINDSYNDKSFIENKSNIFKNSNIGLITYRANNTKITISSPERAILEVISNIKDKTHFSMIHILMDNLDTLDPTKIENILIDCTSELTKRYFLFLSERINHAWFKDINLRTINAGTGSICIATNGYFDKKYKITVPTFYKKK